MLSDEEKKAMKDCDIIFINLEDMMSEEGAEDYRKSYKILKNLIEKQQKEIEQKDNIIDAMAEQLITPVHNKQWVIDYFEEKCK